MGPSAQLTYAQSPKSIHKIALIKNISYRAAIGSLMHLAVDTRLDIMFAVSTVTQFSLDPKIAHWKAVKKIFKYLSGMKGLVLTFDNGKKGLQSYIDANRGSQEHWHTISGYAYLLDMEAISWASKKQKIVTLSTAQVKYIAVTHTAKEGIWLYQFIAEVFCPLKHPMPLHSDSQSAIMLIRDESFHMCMKHIDI